MEGHTRAYERLKERMNKDRRERFGADLGLLFNNKSIFSDRDRDAMVWLYSTKLLQGEFNEEMIGDYKRCIKEVAKLYLAQKCAFQDVLTKEGYDATQEVLKDYDGKIAALSNNGTLLMLGRDRGIGRLLTMKRIHTPQFDQTGAIVYLPEDLKIGYPAVIKTKSRNEFYSSSPLRGLAIKTNGCEDDKLEIRAQQTLIRSIDETCDDFRHLSVDRLVEMSIPQRE